MDAIYVKTGIVGSDLLRRKVRVRGVAVGQKVRNRGGMPPPRSNTRNIQKNNKFEKSMEKGRILFCNSRIHS